VSSGAPEIVLVGSGGIGSRHLQGLKKLDRPAHVHIVDPSSVSLELATARWEEIDGGREQRLSTGHGFEGLPSAPDVVIVATTSSVRREVVEEVFRRSAPRHLVLEKFLFPSVKDFEVVGSLVHDAGCRAWVNTTRRLWQSYRQLGDELDTAHPVSLRVSAQLAHGLGSNSVHFLDLLSSLNGRPPGQLDGSLLRPIPNERRRGNIEFEGAVHGYGPASDYFSYSVSPGTSAPLIVHITAGEQHFVIDESNQRILRNSTGEGQSWAISPFPTELQSDLTGPLVEELVDDGTCSLPTYEESTAIHLALLEVFLASYRKHVDVEAATCLVT
jgi:predicted dehydrogenase